MQASPFFRIALLLIATVLITWSIAAAQVPKPAAVQTWELTKVDRGTEGWKKTQALAGEG